MQLHHVGCDREVFVQSSVFHHAGVAAKVELIDVKDAEEQDDSKYDSREQTSSCLWNVPAEI